MRKRLKVIIIGLLIVLILIVIYIIFNFRNPRNNLNNNKQINTFKHVEKNNKNYYEIKDEYNKVDFKISKEYERIPNQVLGPMFIYGFKSSKDPSAKCLISVNTKKQDINNIIQTTLKSFKDNFRQAELKNSKPIQDNTDIKKHYLTIEYQNKNGQIMQQHEIIGNTGQKNIFAFCRGEKATNDINRHDFNLFLNSLKFHKDDQKINK
ncbi:MAG: hypothetical protein GF332_04225 [Candidatus Moranbacteria bacterium]|nr:hypothetical protein [Candidatus Moranbacteria bacterium]